MGIENAKIGTKVKLNLAKISGEFKPFFGHQGIPKSYEINGMEAIIKDINYRCPQHMTISLQHPSWSRSYLLKVLPYEVELVEEEKLINIGQGIKMRIIKEITPDAINNYYNSDKRLFDSCFKANFDRLLESTKETGFFKQPSIKTLEELFHRWPWWFNWLNKNGFIWALEKVREPRIQTMSMSLSEIPDDCITRFYGLTIHTTYEFSEVFKNKIANGVTGKLTITLETEE